MSAFIKCLGNVGGLTAKDTDITLIEAINNAPFRKIPNSAQFGVFALIL